MSRTTRRWSDPAEDAPQDPARSLDAEATQLYVALADALPNGRKQLGNYAVRVTLAAKHRYVPRLDDLTQLAASGGDTAQIVALLEGAISMVKAAAPAEDANVCAATLARETAEAVAATFLYTQDPSPERERDAIRELAGADAMIERAKAVVFARRRQRIADRWSILSRLPRPA